ncbi:MAG: hypothetical protein LQ343_004798 [Gyalolechia ehrenbergii]|nr:MAG: hypothetical protein LQ343_004798 [Gyalolechia ehrenbergii]
MASPPSNPSPPNPTQIPPLPGVHRHITTHTPTGLATFHSSTSGDWKTLSPSLSFNVLYTTPLPPSLPSTNGDITAHEELLATQQLGLVHPRGSVCRMVDFGPSTGEGHAAPLMHRTESLDYGIVVMGEVECVLDGGESRVMRVGDVAVQRGTMHAWRNRSATEWARMVFVLLGIEGKIGVEGGRELGEDLKEVPEGMRAALEERERGGGE